MPKDVDPREDPLHEETIFGRRPERYQGAERVARTTRQVARTALRAYWDRTP